MVGTEVKKARAALKLSQDAYAARTGLCQQTVSQLESGSSAEPRLSTVIALVFRGGMKLTRNGLKAV